MPIHILKYKLLSLYNITHMYAFRADSLQYGFDVQFVALNTYENAYLGSV